MKDKENNKVLISVPNLSEVGGVSSFWNALFTAFKSLNSTAFKSIEIGGHGKNIFGAVWDQWRFYRAMTSEVKLGLVNPSLLNKSFFRDGFFAKQLAWKNIPFVVFFHGWELDFEAEVDKKYVNFFMNSFGKAEKIFVLSLDFKKKIEEWGYKGEVIVETTNADGTLVDNYTLAHRRSVLEDDKEFKILYLARLIREKGAFELLEAFNILSTKYKNIELIIAGGGEDFDALKSLVANKENVRVLGDVVGEAKINLFKESHVYALPSYYGEGLPTTILEAMLFGLPLISSDAGGLKHFFEDDKMGFLVETKNANDVATKIEKYLLDREKMFEISKYNFNYAQDKLTNVAMAKRLDKHLTELVG
ncbi:MAG: Glycosyltransferase involved in cell wall bisynthesis [uncultured Sulfurovum sp.]|uniref:Glycosyltransferase involved in cell wall bisynthesis n=1 Tax=uncultured Sulfurovum sp. TaxID=269237 RepID=A0A6S6SWD5_9BACT|nr:MAG: Glycosyltransferase involved in cell wall bisynthesis [uncultured Sulfurovum sp.]